MVIACGAHRNLRGRGGSCGGSVKAEKSFPDKSLRSGREARGGRKRKWGGVVIGATVLSTSSDEAVCAAAAAPKCALFSYTSDETADSGIVIPCCATNDAFDRWLESGARMAV